MLPSLFPTVSRLAELSSCSTFPLSDTVVSTWSFHLISSLDSLSSESSSLPVTIVLKSFAANSAMSGISVSITILANQLLSYYTLHMRNAPRLDFKECEVLFWYVVNLLTSQ